MTAVEGQAALVAGLVAAGDLTQAWRPAFEAADRARFLPRRIWVRGDDGYRSVDQDTDSAAWRAAAYRDAPVVTQVADPAGAVAYRPTSSASMPRIVARMLDLLQVAEGHRVLEAGTGTGWNAALLCRRLGDGRVTTVETDPALAERARTALRRAGYEPAVVTGDASLGHHGRAPYDRVIATYAVHTVPRAWVAQIRPGGIIVTPWGTGLYNGVLLQLTAHGDGTASGPVVDDSAFMWDRGQAPAGEVMDTVHRTSAAPEPGRTSLDPRRVLGVDDAAFAAGLLVPGVRYSVGHGPQGSGQFTLWLAHPATGSWASVDYTPEADEYEVEQHGHRRLWHEAERAYTWWQAAGSPRRTRFGLTVTPTGQQVWLDTPGNTPLRTSPLG